MVLSPLHLSCPLRLRYKQYRRSWPLVFAQEPRGNGRCFFKSLFVSSHILRKRAQDSAKLHVAILSPLELSSARPQRLASEDLRPSISFSSSAIRAISKPSRKTSAPRDLSTAVIADSPVCLYTRAQKQTVKTAYLGMERKAVLSGPMGQLTAKNGLLDCSEL